MHADCIIFGRHSTWAVSLGSCVFSGLRGRRFLEPFDICTGTLILNAHCRCGRPVLAWTYWLLGRPIAVR